eukprot:TRINITY_DN17599_c0_g1_i1.p1 TRINITY_DN17599_c0_g1~~TRINITY_DN17599_c0_g1_i1.p1  ORF type:complete len:477 (+),score=100.68 TRINITY_DN17599_c0_g1_i1:29-1459(+)
MVLEGILRNAKGRGDVLPSDLSERMEGRQGFTEGWDQTMPNPSAHGLRCAFIEAEAVKKLTKITDEAVSTMVSLRLCAVELCPDAIRNSSFPSSPPSVSLTPSEMSIEEDEIGRAVASALAPSSGICPDKADTTTTLVTDKAAAFLGRWIAREWRNKEGSILTELLTNLESPLVDKIPIIAKASSILQKRAPELKDHCRLELFVMTLYTMAGHDIDAMMGFKNVPSKPTSPAWAQYKPRNQPMFRVINSAMRVAGSNGQSPNAKEWPWSDIKKWVKTIVLLTALSGKGGKFELSRGLAGLPADVVAAHSKLKNGNMIYWSAPSSCALDPSVSKAYLNGDAANATQQEGGRLLFELRSTCGLPLQKVSKYPGEAEVLLPPLTELAVHSVTNENGLVSIKAVGSCRMKEHLKGVCLDSHPEALRASKELDQTSTPRKRLPFQSTSPSPRRVIKELPNDSPLLNPTRATEGKVVYREHN